MEVTPAPVEGPAVVQSKKKTPKRPEHLRDIDITAWRVAAKMCGYLVKGKKKEEGGPGFQHLPKSGTPEHAEIKLKQAELIREWELADAIPEEYRSKRDPNAPPKPRKQRAVKRAAAAEPAVTAPSPIAVECCNCHAKLQLEILVTAAAEPPAKRRRVRRAPAQPAEAEAEAKAEAVVAN